MNFDDMHLGGFDFDEIGEDAGVQDSVPQPLECVECGTLSGPDAPRWRSYRIDDPNEDEEPALAFYCPVCAEREFGGLGHSSGHGFFQS
jgi:hypothetical protein